jgi:aryl-alcohol dehydrogenase-like predicted oxidoreductase
MEYRAFGRTGLKVSPFCLGTMDYGDEINPPGGVLVNFHNTSGWMKTPIL